MPPVYTNPGPLSHPRHVVSRLLTDQALQQDIASRRQAAALNQWRSEYRGSSLPVSSLATPTLLNICSDDSTRGLHELRALDHQMDPAPPGPCTLSAPGNTALPCGDP